MAINAVIQEEDGKQKIVLDGTVITDCVLLGQKESSACGYDLILRVSAKNITRGRPGAWISCGCIPREALTDGARQKTQLYSPCYPELHQRNKKGVIEVGRDEKNPASVGEGREREALVICYGQSKVCITKDAITLSVR